MSDLIDRQEAIDALNACCVKYDISPNYDDKRTDKEKFYDWWDMHKVLSMRIINDLPSAEKVQLSGEDATFDCISRQATIDVEGLDEQIRCEMCRNPMHTNRGCDGNCKYDEKLYERIMQILGERIKPLPSAEPEIIHCKDCRNRGENECPMRHVERIEWEEDGYIEVDDIVHDYTEPHGYCDKGERNE